MKLPSASQVLVAVFGLIVFGLIARPGGVGERENAARDARMRETLEQLGIRDDRTGPGGDSVGFDDQTPQGATGKLLRGLLPSLLHPTAQKICMVGIGTGRAAYMAAVLPETQRVRCIEADVERVNAIARAAAQHGDHVDRELLGLPHVTFEIGDLTGTLAKQRERFDVIQSVPWAVAHAEPRYTSKEFLELCRSRLTPGGYLCCWAMEEAARRNLRAVFSHGLEMSDPPFAIASDRPIPWNEAWILDQFRRARVRDHLLRASIDPRPLTSLVQALKVTTWKPGDVLASSRTPVLAGAPDED